MNFPVITEQQARELIAEGLAGYWELSLRDSICRRPIGHALQTCVFLAGTWYLVPAEALKITEHGRVGDERASAHVSMVECHDDQLIALIQSEAARLHKPL